jgi:hypothetical protein
MISGETADYYNYLQTQIDKVNKNKNIVAEKSEKHRLTTVGTNSESVITMASV